MSAGSDFGFLSPDGATDEAVWRSPLERALAHAPAGIEDVSRTGVLDVRGQVEDLDDGLEVVHLTPHRALVFCAWERTAETRQRLRQRFLTVDVSAGYAGLRVHGAEIVRRLTDLDLERLPAVGSAAHVRAVVLRDGAAAFRLFFPQEYGHYVAEVVVDAAEGVSAG